MSEQDQPGMLTAFLDEVRPDAVCVERSPELAARNDFYEFTYEVQNIVLPYASAHHVSVCPIDWEPSADDMELGLGLNADAIPEVRKPEGFQGFLFDPDKEALTRDLFAADQPANTAYASQWAAKQASKPSRDFPRRLYLYRTFMQAQHIRAAAQAHPGGSVVVVVGEMHKPDLEPILRDDPSIDLVEPSTFPHPSLEQAEQATSAAQLAAILSFNLLGRQSGTGNVNWPWIGRVLSHFRAVGSRPEADLFAARLDQLTGKLSPSAAVRTYQALVARTPADAKFTWTGVKDATRIDSYFDPFGNLTVRQRCMAELARALNEAGGSDDATRVIARLRAELPERMARQFDAYQVYLLSKPKGVAAGRVTA